LYKNSQDEIIYIGKAKNLRARVSQYFQDLDKLSAKTKVLVSHITKIDYVVVNSEVEALLLENKLIKQYKPKYNINLKDDKTFAYLKITSEDYPKLMLTRKVTRDGEYFGPYTSGFKLRELIDFLVKYFQVLTPQSYKNKSTLNYQLGLVPAEKEQLINRPEYLEKIKLIKLLLTGDTISLRKILVAQMQQYSNDKKYELALERKNQLSAIAVLEERQYVDTLKNYDQDVIVFSNTNHEIFIQLFSIQKGTILSKQHFNFEYTQDIFAQFILLNSVFWSSSEEKQDLEQALFMLRHKKVEFIIPQKGEKRELIELALLNLQEHLKNPSVLAEMKDKFKLTKIPRVIEFFDMSNLNSKYLVGGMTRWVDMERDTANSRRFEIKTVKGKNDDFASMREVILRRYSRLKKEQKPFPDLIIVDGGKGQLSTTIDALRSIFVSIEVLSLAKQHEEIFSSNFSSSFKFDSNSAMMLFIRKMRDATHNYVISYNRKKRSMEFKQQSS
jgi:excinuclease ABC subunit C